MSSTTTVYANKFAYLKQESAGSHFAPDSSSWYSVKKSTTEQHLLALGFGQISSSLRHKKLISSKLRIYANVTIASGGYSDYFDIYLNYYRSAANIDSLTYDNSPSTGPGTSYSDQFSGSSFSGAKEIWIAEDSINKGELPPYVTMAMLNNGGVLNATQGRDVTDIGLKTVLANGSTRPYLQITYDESVNVTSTILLKSGPISGYVNPRNDITITWDYGKAQAFTNIYCADETWAQTSAVFYWKTSTDENYQSIPISGATKSVTVPANTFQTASTIQWYVSGTDEDNTTTQTSVYSFSTAASTVVTDPIYPVNTVESNNLPITFRWSYSSADGLPPSSLVLMWKLASGDSWTTIETLTNAETSYTVPANTIPAGEIRWGVHPYNIDGASGTGHTATYISYGAPDAPVVYAENVPFSTITWQSSDQQAYKIMVDDTVYGPYFGTEKSFELPDYLRDGIHVIKVSVCGTYALWSDWGQTTITIQNVPGDDVSLDTEAATDVQLMIETQDSDPTFLIYRDGVLVGKTNRNQFTDRFALGEHTYQVVNKLANGNYSISNETNGTANVQNANIALLEGGEWLEIKFNPKDQSDPQYTDSIMASYNHLSGAEFPSATVSPYRDLTVEYSAVFLYTQQEERKRFESMFKKPVVIKFKDGTVFVGILGSWAKMPFRHFYTAYTFTVTQIDFEDYIDDTE